MAIFGTRDFLLFEAEDDPDEGFKAAPADAKEDDDAGGGDEGGEAKQDDAADDNKEATDDDKGEENNEEGGDDQEGDDTANEDNDDFNIDANMDPGGDDEGGEEGGGDAGGDSGASGGTPEPPTNTPEKKKDKEMFDSLSPEEQKIKTARLKKLYLELYSNCNYVIEKFNSVNMGYDKVKLQLKRTLSILFDLKQMISDYILTIFDYKTYIENDIMFNRYLTILNSVKAITIEVNKACKDPKEDKKEESDSK